jgi:hypothetical protein
VDDYSKEDMQEALRIVTSVINTCKKMEPRFREGTPQHSLLRNRIKAMHISKSLMSGDNDMAKYTKVELTEALPPISSIIHKCEKAQQKFAEGTSLQTRMKEMMKAMYISKTLIIDEMNKSDNG